MCIALISTAHPRYPFILLSNRDEFLTRRTARSHWWDEPHSHVLGGQDLERKEKGTWLGITTDGRIAVLTNFRDEGVEVTRGKSRGGIVTAWLKPLPYETKDEQAFAEEMIEKVGIHDVGGFSLVYGHLRTERGDGLAIISNRTSSASGLVRLAKDSGETHGLSNSHYGDFSWPKVVHGELMLRQAIAGDVSRGDNQEEFVRHLFDLLSVDTLPKRKQGEEWSTFVRQLRNSIFIPPIGGQAVNNTRADTIAAGAGDQDLKADQSSVTETMYGTQKQTVILVDLDGKVTWVERTLFDENAQPVPEATKDVKVEFQVQGWQ